MSGVTRSIGRSTRCSLGLVLALAGCAGGLGDPATRAELGNIRLSNVVPKSSPKSMIAAFERYCLDTGGDAARAGAALRASDYVEVPERGSDGLRSWVVDDRRPAVMVGHGVQSGACAVAVSPRTGQTEAVQRLVADRLGGARGLSPDRVGRGVEQAWATADGAVVFTRRGRLPDTEPYYMLGVLHGRGAGA